MTYCEVKRFLDQHTDVVELADGAGAGWRSARHGSGG